MPGRPHESPNAARLRGVLAQGDAAALRHHIAELEREIAQWRRADTLGLDAADPGNLKRRADFEATLIDLATSLIKAPAALIDRTIEHGLGTLGTFMGAEIGLVIVMHDGQGATVRSETVERARTTTTHLWQAPGSSALRPLGTETPLGLLQSEICQLIDGRPIRLHSAGSIGEGQQAVGESWLGIGARSVAIVPVTLQGETVACVGFATLAAERDWSDDEMNLLGALAALVGNALARKHSETELLLYASRLETLHEIERGIVGAGSPEAIAGAVLARLQEIVACERTSVLIFDATRERGRIYAPQATSSRSVGRGQSWPIGVLLPPELVAQTDVTTIEDLRIMEDATPMMKRLAAEGVRSVLMVPLATPDGPIGYLQIARATPGAFPPPDVETALEVATTLSVALHDCELRRRLSQHADSLERRVEERTRALLEKVDDVESFTTTVSRDLRGPLRGLQGLTQALAEDYGHLLDHTGRTYVQRVQGSVRRLDALLSDLVDYARVSSDELAIAPTSLDAAVTLAASELAGMLRQQDATLEVVRPLPDVYGDTAQLVHVLRNLIDNAARFVAPGVPPRIRLGATPRGRWLRVWVEDNGIGIDPAYHARIFRVFERLYNNETYPGTGIGLAIVQKAVNRMGGGIGVESAPGAGSRFWFELEAVTPGPEGDSGATETAPPGPA